MPLIIMTGFPSSGKTTATKELCKFFVEKGKKVNVISENDILREMDASKNAVYGDSKKEKEIRSIVKTRFTRDVGPDALTIVDALNYIKGYRYELYCVSKSAKTTQCTVHCQTGKDISWEFNEQRDDERYGREIFEELCMRYEAPDGNNRWDSPLFYLMSDRGVPFLEIFEALYCRKPPPPNQSTQCPPVSDTNFLHELDMATQDVISCIISNKKLNVEGEVKIPGCDECFLLVSERNTSLPELLRLKRQFLTYVKLHPTLYNDSHLKKLFVQYLNTNL